MKKNLFISILFIFISASVFVSYSISSWFSNNYSGNKCSIEMSIWSTLSQKDKLRFLFQCVKEFKIINPECKEPIIYDKNTDKDYVLYIECIDRQEEKEKEEITIMKASYP